MRVFLSSGESSGDAMAAEVAAVLRRRLSGDLELQVLSSTPLPGVAPSEVLLETPEALQGVDGVAVGEWKRTMAAAWRLLAERPPDLFIGFSHHAFNLPLAADLRDLGVGTRSVMVAPPEIWAWNVRPWVRLLRLPLVPFARRRQSEGFVLRALLDRGRSCLESFDLLACLFPPNEVAYRALARRLGLAESAVARVGHPFARYASPAERQRVEARGLELRRQAGVDAEATVLGLLPGSRYEETRLHLPMMLKAAEELAASGRIASTVLVSSASARRRAQIDEVLEAHRRSRPEAGVRPLVDDGPEGVLAAADVSAVCSGTATLQAACLGAPSLLLYHREWGPWRLRALRALVTRGALDIDGVRTPAPFALANALIGTRLLPELVLEEATVDRLVDGLGELIADEARRRRMRETVPRVLAQLGPPPAEGAVASPAMEAVVTRALELLGR